MRRRGLPGARWAPRSALLGHTAACMGIRGGEQHRKAGDRFSFAMDCAGQRTGAAAGPLQAAGDAGRSAVAGARCTCFRLCRRSAALASRAASLQRWWHDECAVQATAPSKMSCTLRRRQRSRGRPAAASWGTGAGHAAPQPGASHTCSGAGCAGLGLRGRCPPLP